MMMGLGARRSRKQKLALRRQDRTLEEGTNNEEKDLSEGVVSVSVIA